MGCNRCSRGHDDYRDYNRRHRYDRRDDYYPRPPFDHRGREFHHDSREFPRRRVIIIGPRRPF